MERKRHGREKPAVRVLRCGPTRKVCFKSHKAALARGGELLADDSRKDRNRASGFRAYRCNYCGQFHLTTKV